jgi:hypothetical protein
MSKLQITFTTITKRKHEHIMAECGKTVMENLTLCGWLHWKQKPIRLLSLILILDSIHNFYIKLQQC